MTSKHRILWGSATSSFQIEGGATQDGKGPSIWDTFCRIPGKIGDQSNGDIACDHYNRIESDVNLMQELGLDTYRFSISWPRIFPEGTGTLNRKGLAFYDRLVDALLAKGIEPYPTLYHWDLPQALQDKGGWTNPNISDWFADYIEPVVSQLADRVHNWTTLNEPHVFCFLGYGLPVHAPGAADRTQYMQAIRNALLAHGKAAQRIRGIHKQLRVGIANCWPLPQPLDPSHAEAANRLDQLTNRIYFDPIIHGTVPPWVAQCMAEKGVTITDEDLKQIHQPLDFLGINYYMRMLASSTGDPAKPYTMQHPRYDGAEITDCGWEVYPEGLEIILKTIRDDYGNIPVFITENGCAYNDGIMADGLIHDKRRQRYYESHIKAMHRAIDDGCDVRGYFAWSLMDNFEWAHGYSQRFGIVYVDYKDDCKRIIKDSGYWYQYMIRQYKKRFTL